MRVVYAVLAGLFSVSCGIFDESPSRHLRPQQPDENTPAFFENVKGYIDADHRANEYLIKIELEQGMGQINFLVPMETEDLCRLIDDEFYFAYSGLSCAHSVYARYGLGLRDKNARLHVEVSGHFVAKSRNMPNDYHSVVLTEIKKPTACPVAWSLEDVEYPFAGTYWRFMGFVDSAGELYSYPVCEESFFGLEFSHTLVMQSTAFYLLNYLDSKLFNILSFVWYEPQSGAYAYVPLNETQFLSLRAPWSNMYPSGPATRSRDNLHQVPRRMKEKHDSLRVFLNHNDTINFQLNKNTLKLSNPKKELEAFFVAEPKE